jgi:hypothetical protein
VTGDLPRSLEEGEPLDRINVAASVSWVRAADSTSAEFTGVAAELLTAEPRRAPPGCSARL